MEPGEVITDEHARRHRLVECLGRGGQGEVWSTASARHVVKFRHTRSGAEEVRRQFLRIKHANLHGICVARPLALLAPPHIGYVAEYLEGMQPIRALMRPTTTDKPIEWHRSTGGLRRRLRLLAHLGESLSALHAAGFAYGDLSHANAFVSVSPSAEEAWLIDLDNLASNSDPAKAVFTPGYGAPEVVAGHAGLSSYSDAWSFAVLTFQTLTTVHPFLGDGVQNGDPELEERAFAGKLPWVDDQADRSNASTQGLPRAAVISPRLLALTALCFGPGRMDPPRRPGVGSWTESLHVAADFTAECASCHGSYYVTAKTCPWCTTTRQAAWMCVMQRWHPSRRDPDLKADSYGPGQLLPMRPPLAPHEAPRATWLQLASAILSGDRLELPRRITHGETGHAAREIGMTLRLVPGGVRLDPPHGATYLLEQDGRDPKPLPPAGATLALDRKQGLVLNGASAWIHFGPNDQPHRVMTIGAFL